MGMELTIGFLPLVDACLPILAREHGFAEEEGLSLRLVKDMSWATVLDRLLYGHTHAAHLVAPLALAVTLGRGRPAQPLSVPFVLGLNGNAVTMRPDLAARVGMSGRLGDPVKVGAALKAVVQERLAAGNPIRLGVVHRYSSHNYMLRYWLAASGIRPDRDVEITTVAPPFCADALEAGEVDAICVGEPWNSVAVERGAGEIVLATAQIWRRGVEKVLALREPLLDDRRDAVEAEEGQHELHLPVHVERGLAGARVDRHHITDVDRGILLDASALRVTLAGLHVFPHAVDPFNDHHLPAVEDLEHLPGAAFVVARLDEHDVVREL